MWFPFAAVEAQSVCRALMPSNDVHVYLRPYQTGDASGTAEIFRDAIRVIAAPFYSPEQVRAWSALADDLTTWDLRLARGVTLVAEVDGIVGAFGQLDPWDRLALLYTHSRFTRRGLASRLCEALEREARARGASSLRTEASVFSKPLLARRSFEPLEKEHVYVGEVAFTRWRMLKRLRAVAS